MAFLLFRKSLDILLDGSCCLSLFVIRLGCALTLVKSVVLTRQASEELLIVANVVRALFSHKVQQVCKAIIFVSSSITKQLGEKVTFRGSVDNYKVFEVILSIFVD